MAGTRASIQVLLVLTVLASHEGRAWPAGGLGGLFSNRGSQAGMQQPATSAPPSASPSFNPLSFPQQIYSTFVGPHKPSGAATPAAPTAAAPHHVHRETTTTVTKRVETSTSTTTTTTTTTTTSAAPPTKAAAPASSTTPAPDKEDGPLGERMSETGLNPMGSKAGAYSEDQLKVCREKWLELYNSDNGTANEDIDILAILLENGGFPGQLQAIQWKQNASESGRWDYFVGDTDYKTFIRIENGTIKSQKMPVQGATPNTVVGEIYWSPPDFCGKLRHAKYELAPELRASHQLEVCFIEKDPVSGHDRVTCWKAPECVEPLEPGKVCPRGGVSGALMASLVG